MLPGVPPLVLLATGAAIAAVVVLALFRARQVVGWGPLYATVGALQLAGLLSSDVVIEAGLVVSPGGATLVPAGLLALLVTHLREGTHRARDLLLGLIAATIAGSALLSLSHPALGPGPIAILGRSALVFLDAAVILLTYEVVGRLAPGLWLRVTAAFGLALHADAMLCTVLDAALTPAWLDHLYARLAGASVATVVYSAVACGYLYLLEDRAWTWVRRGEPLFDLMPVLTLQQRFAPLRTETLRDRQSGVYSRLFFEDSLPIELDRAQQYGRHTSIVLLRMPSGTASTEAPEARHGAMGRALMEALRMTDVPCRYDENVYAAILPGADREATLASTERLRRVLDDQARARGRAPGAAAPDPEVAAFTYGVASYPDDGDAPSDLMDAAIRRLERHAAQPTRRPSTPAAG